MTSIVEMPAIRRLIVPSPGHMLIDADLSSADAQFVAAEAGATKLRALFASGTFTHMNNAIAVWGDKAGERERQLAKIWVHATHYGATARTIAIQAGTSIAVAEEFQQGWFREHPEIPIWHTHVAQQLQLTREVRNIWGFRRFYFDRLDNILPQALAWLCQSSVSGVINRGMLRIRQELPEVRVLLQDHDSLLMQAPIDLCPAIYPTILDKMRVEVPYSEPLVIAVTLKHSDRSWGEVEKWEIQ